MQTYLRDTASSVSDQCHKASITIKQVIIFFAGGGSFLQFVKNAVSEVQYNEVCLYYAVVEMNELFLLATT